MCINTIKCAVGIVIAYEIFNNFNKFDELTQGLYAGCLLIITTRSRFEILYYLTCIYEYKTNKNNSR